MPGIHITDIEAAINYWRHKKPSPDGVTLAPELRALAEVYALLVFYREEEADERSFPPKALEAWSAWYDTTADTPCIAICSTSQGDAMCKGVQLNKIPCGSVGVISEPQNGVLSKGGSYKENHV